MTSRAGARESRAIVRALGSGHIHALAVSAFGRDGRQGRSTFLLRLLLRLPQRPLESRIG